MSRPSSFVVRLCPAVMLVVSRTCGSRWYCSTCVYMRLRINRTSRCGLIEYAASAPSCVERQVLDCDADKAVCS